MEIFEKIFAILKLPFRFIFTIAFILGLVLFLPESLIEQLQLTEFKTEYGKFIGIFFLISAGYLVVSLIIYIWNKIRLKIATNNFKKNIGKVLTSLKMPDIYLLREFILQGKDVIELHEKRPEKNLRRIFINVPFLDIENQWLQKYKEIIAQHPDNKLPDFWNDGLNLAYIYSTECKLEKSYKRMIEYFQWFKNFFPLNIQPGDKCVQVLNSGFLYAFGRDHQFRPLLICQPYILQKCLDLFSGDDIYNASIFICQYMCNYMMIPGQIENWIMIVNMEGTNILSIPESVKKLMNSLSEYFISRLYRCYILGLNAFLRIIYKIICAFFLI